MENHLKRFLTDEEFINIHKTLHKLSKNEQVAISLTDEDNKIVEFNVEWHPNGCAMVKINSPNCSTIITQNPKKASKWAKLAREGHQVTWCIYHEKWTACVDGVIEGTTEPKTK